MDKQHAKHLLDQALSLQSNIRRISGSRYARIMAKVCERTERRLNLFLAASEYAPSSPLVTFQ